MKMTCPHCRAHIEAPPDITCGGAQCPECGHALSLDVDESRLPPAAPPGALGTPPSAPVPSLSNNTIEDTAPSEIAPAAPNRSGHALWRRTCEVARQCCAGVKRIQASLSMQAQILRLQYDSRQLQRALRDQWERLGARALDHRPGDLDIGEQTDRLATIEADLAEKETTLASLKETRGSGPVVRDLKCEIAETRARRQQAIVEIGMAVDDKRPEMPNIAGSYGALDRIKTRLMASKSALAELAPEDDCADTADTAGRLLRRYRRPLLIAGIAIGAILVLYVVRQLLNVLFGSRG